MTMMTHLCAAPLPCLRKAQEEAQTVTPSLPPPPPQDTITNPPPQVTPITDPRQEVTIAIPSSSIVINPYLKKRKADCCVESIMPLSASAPHGPGEEIHSFVVPTHVDGGSSINDIALFFRQSPNLFADQAFVTRIRATNFAPTPHLSTTQRLTQRMLKAIIAHPRLKFLADTVPDPEAPDKFIPRLFSLVRGVPMENKMDVLNSVMCLFGESFFLLKYNGVNMDELSPKEKAEVSYPCSVCLFIVTVLTSNWYSLFTTGRIPAKHAFYLPQAAFC
jgi:hypothetical protein